MTTSSPVPDELLTSLAALEDVERVLMDPADTWSYGYDNSRRHGVPSAVVFPRSHEAVAEIVRLCHRYETPVIPRGRGTATTGAAVPLGPAVVVALERLNRIIRIDAANRLAVVEPGVTNAELQEAAGREGFFWAPDPSSAAVCSIGGNLACNAAGPRAVKYGTCRENTLGLRAVTGEGKTLRTGTQTTKGVVGYDFTRLLLGSEGTLGIITEATLRLTPIPEGKRTLRAVYRDMESAAHAVARIMAQPVTPCAVEFMDSTALDLVRRYGGIDLPQAGALLMLEVDGAEAFLATAASAIADAAQGPGAVSVDAAETPEAVAELWAARKALSPCLRQAAPKKINEDVVVPVSRMPDLIDGLASVSREYGILIVNFGHAGNGNIHVNLLYEPDDPRQAAAAEPCLNSVFDLVLRLGGTLSGEHGVGIDKRDHVAREIDPVTLELMGRVKQQFDPAGILNPYKGLPDSLHAPGPEARRRL